MNRLFQSFLLASSLSVSAVTGCSVASSPEEVGVDQNEIVDVAQTDVERQSIGNCWIYAHASWIESMHLSATGSPFDVSQSYWTYWHWFDQIAGGWTTTISTGGNWSTANNIIKKYGLMAEKDFVFADTQSEMSSRQKSALDALNASLKNGVLADQAARRDKKKVRAEMDRAWGLSAQHTAMLDRVFGEGVTRTFSSSSSPANNTSTAIVRGQDFDVAYTRGGADNTRGQARVKLSQAIGEWREVYYSRSSRRSFLQRVQRALHDAQPVVITWFVDFNAMENRQNALRGSFNIDTLNEFGPGRQGGHMTVLEDYQAQLADGTLLKAGVTIDKTTNEGKTLLERALQNDTQVQFLRVKNSWGAARPDRAFAPGMPGYHDLYLNYLDGTIKRCNENEAGETDPTDCPWTTTPLQNVVLPPGY